VSQGLRLLDVGTLMPAMLAVTIQKITRKNKIKKSRHVAVVGADAGALLGLRVKAPLCRAPSYLNFLADIRNAAMLLRARLDLVEFTSYGLAGPGVSRPLSIYSERTKAENLIHIAINYK
jgi:hypothetical protein